MEVPLNRVEVPRDRVDPNDTMFLSHSFRVQCCPGVCLYTCTNMGECIPNGSGKTCTTWNGTSKNSTYTILGLATATNLKLWGDIARVSEKREVGGMDLI